MNKNAYIGMDVEKLFKNSIPHQRAVLETLREYFNIGGEFAKAYKTGTDSGKSDVILKFSDGNTLSANIKAYKAGFNQITRLKIPAFCSQFAVPELQVMLEEGAVRVAKRAGRFILESDEEWVFNILNPLAEKILRFSIARLENPELLVLFDRITGTMLLYDMRKLLDNLDYKISFSKRGIINIGEFFTIQRKGGNGVHSLHIERTSLEHPGNNLQVKMNIRKFVLKHEPIVSFIP